MRPLEDAQAGEILGPYRYKLTTELARFVASDIGQESFETNALGEAIAPSCVTDNDYVNLWGQDFIAKEAVHAKAEHHYLHPPVIGKELIVTGKISDRYNRKGRDYLIFESVTRDEDGTEIVRSKNALLINL